MSQKCYSCGRETPLGQPMQHFYQCDVAGGADPSAKSPAVLAPVDVKEVLAVLDSVQAAKGVINGIVTPLGNAHPVAGELIPDISAARAAVERMAADLAAANLRAAGLSDAVKLLGQQCTTLRQRAEADAANRDELLDAARTYWTRYCQDEAGDDGEHITGCSRQQHLDARTLGEVIALQEPRP